MSQLRLQLVETRLSQACRAVPYYTRHGAPYTVLRVSVLCDQVFHALGDIIARTPDRQVLVDLLACDCVDKLEVLWVCRCGGVFGCGREEELISDRVCECDNFDIVGFAEVLLCYRASCDSS